MQKLVLDRRYWLFPLAMWSLLVTVSLLWNANEADTHSREIVHERASFIFELISSMRLWNASHGGVYALIDPQNPPNPHLEVAERDITTPSGRPLTLINPAYMTRQLAEIIRERNSVLIRMTSLKPINPDNAPVPWEADALRRFEQEWELKEWSAFSGEGEGREFRYIAPLVTRKPCLKCHEKQGYQMGDIRGGISITFPSGPLLASQVEVAHSFWAIHLGVWLMLVVLTLFGLSRHRRQLLRLQAMMAAQDELVERRTDQLQQEVFAREATEEKLQRYIASSGEGMLVVDQRLNCTLCNPSALQILGYKEQHQVLGRHIHDFLCPHTEAQRHVSGAHCEACTIRKTLHAGELIHDDESHFRRADGHTIPVELRSSPITLEGTVLGLVITFSDISVRKRREMELRKLSMAVEHSPAAVMITDVNGHIEYVNRQFLQGSGFMSSEVLGRTPALMSSGMTPRDTYDALWMNIKAGRNWQGELLNRKKSGELIWESVSISPINDCHGNVSNFVAIKEEINARKEREEVIWRQANLDSLTGLFNRRCFMNRLELLVSEAGRYERCFALLFIDLDGFKTVNDTLGHDGGDELLKDAARRLEGSLRDSDIIARLGGDEFTILMPDLEQLAAAEVLSEKLLTLLADVFQIKGQAAHVSASIGIAAYPDHGCDSTTLLNQADAAMYRAKRAGKNRFCWPQE